MNKPEIITRDYPEAKHITKCTNRRDRDALRIVWYGYTGRYITMNSNTITVYHDKQGNLFYDVRDRHGNIVG